MSLRPDETVQKALLSTPSRFVGEYETDEVLLTHAWHSFNDLLAPIRWAEGPASRSAYILAFRTKSVDKSPGNPLPDYSPTGEEIASYLSVLFGKRFDFHGLIEGIGYYHIPNLSQFDSLAVHDLPHNSHKVRPDFNIPLNLSETGRLAPLLVGNTLPSKFIHTFHGCAKFYLQALQNFELDPEVAYLHLISAGEILSNYHDFDKPVLLDDEMKGYLKKIRIELVDGEKIAGRIEARLLFIKRRFIETINNFIDPSFFNQSEADWELGQFKPETFRQSVAAAYDLRSKYVHTGTPFGRWISLRLRGNNEVQIAKPVLDDKDFAKVIHRAPTFIGLERLIRYCLIRFAERHGAYLNR